MSVLSVSGVAVFEVAVFFAGVCPGFAAGAFFGVAAGACEEAAGGGCWAVEAAGFWALGAGACWACCAWGRPRKMVSAANSVTAKLAKLNGFFIPSFWHSPEVFANELGEAAEEE